MSSLADMLLDERRIQEVGLWCHQEGSGVTLMTSGAVAGTLSSSPAGRAHGEAGRSRVVHVERCCRRERLQLLQLLLQSLVLVAQLLTVPL